MRTELVPLPGTQNMRIAFMFCVTVGNTYSVPGTGPQTAATTLSLRSLTEVRTTY